MDAQHTIIIADDHPLFRNALLLSIQKEINNTTLLEADSLDSLITLLKQTPDMDLLLLDLKMPGTDGLSGLIQLRQQFTDLPIVVISANEEDSVITQVYNQGAFGFIPKSSDIKTLLNALKQILNGERYFPITISQTHHEHHQGLSEKIATLTPQQYKVLNMLTDGLLNKQIAYGLNVSEATIKAHLTAIFRKLEVTNRTQAVVLLQQLQGH